MRSRYRKLECRSSRSKAGNSLCIVFVFVTQHGPIRIQVDCLLICDSAFQKYGINVTTDNQEVVSNSDVVWVAVKPHAVARVLREVAPCIKQDQHYIVSAAAGITLKTLEKVTLVCLG